MIKEREIIEFEFNRVFNERYRRACNIKKLNRRKRLKDMFTFKTKYKP